ncbi:DUF11 domain-containing protein [Lignipirellula cremea]|uniref:DUF11 domain-containing protein n=1 Tax=Lignipirellula cremea TaxID=2528010 RepID=A0A518E2Y2_9BACT|nr:DUF11 domain-containing protein [Lignipirellula cremea]QDU98444.1 hypothetical protein Pla8534_63120 [Lignipirellula cremea]
MALQRRFNNGSDLAAWSPWLLSLVLLCSCRTPGASLTAQAPHRPDAPPPLTQPAPAAQAPPVVAPQASAATAAPTGVAQVAYHQDPAVVPASDPGPAYCPPGSAGAAGQAAQGGFPHPGRPYAGGYPQGGYAGAPFGMMPYAGAMLPPGAASGPPQPIGPAIYSANPYGQWQPPRIGGEWPRDEYVFDGGDRNQEVQVDYDWTVRGLDLEDTVAHYDTLDGRVMVEPSNRTPIYAPRFAAVRKIYGVVVTDANEGLIAAESQSQAMLQEETRIPTTMMQPIEAIGQIGVGQPSNISDRTRGLTVGTLQKVTEYQGDLGVHNDFQIFHRGVFENSEKARLSEYTAAVGVWTENQMTQVLFDAEKADVESSTTAAQVVYVNEDIPGNPRLQLVKTASTRAAKPGDIIEFSLRFDNIGDEIIGNVTLIDNLTPRLEYVPDSAQSNPPAKLYTDVNEGDSLILRWELESPLLPGKGGVIHFKCRMR